MAKSWKTAHGLPMALALAAIFGLAGPTIAQNADPVFDRLSAARSLRCTFSTGTSANWDSGEPVLKPSNFGSPLHFDAVDWHKKKARLIGNAGVEDVYALLTAEGLTFIEQTPSGNYALTTVFPSYQPSTRDFIAVHSRHMNIFGPVPSQYHGTCKVWE